MTKEDFIIIPFKSNRFAIADKESKILDDAQGYGYKTIKNAYAVLNYKFLGGKEKSDKQKKDYQNWLKADPLHKKIVNHFHDMLFVHYKDGDDITINEIWKNVINQYNIDIPDFVKKQALKE